MSLRVGWNFGSTVEDEGQDVVMQDPPCWNATSAVLKAGRGLSSWLFSNLSPPSSPPIPSFPCKDPFMTRQLLTTNCSRTTAASTLLAPHRPRPSINTVPQELLEQVFREYLHGSPEASSPSSLSGSFRRIAVSANARTTPFVLAHVCSSWRDIVMSDPSLWSRLCAFDPEPRDVTLFEFWLSRSSGYPLDLTIIHRGCSQIQAVDDVAFKIFLASLGQGFRWKSVYLQLGPELEPSFATCDQPLSAPLPSLRSFYLDLIDWTAEGNQCVSRMLSISPVLRDAAWGDARIIPSPLSDTPWRMLRTIQFGHVNLSDLLPILNLTASLRILSIDYLQIDRASPCTSSSEHGPHIELSSLTSLTLMRYDYLSPLFDSLRVPALSSLTLNLGVGSILTCDAGWASLTKLVHRSRCCITSLTWSDYFLPEQDSLGRLNNAHTSVFPRLRHLCLESPVGLGTVNALTSEANFSSLRTLEMTDCNATYPSVEAMISSRPNLDWVSIKLRDDEGMCGHVELSRTGEDPLLYSKN